MIQFPIQKLKTVLVNEGLIKEADFDALVSEGERLNQKLEDILISRGIISLDYYYNALSHYLGVALVNLNAVGSSIDEKVLNKLSVEVAKQKRLILFKEEADGVLDVAMEDPSDLQSIEFLERYLGTKVRPFLARPSDLEKGFAIYNKQLTENFKKIIEDNIKNSLQLKGGKDDEAAASMPIVAIVESLLSYAISLRASDIHIEVLENAVLVRFRVDGILHEIIRIPKDVDSAILARIKLLGGLKIDEHYKPQDGRFNHKVGEDKLDIRVAVMPTLYGEKIEMRLLPAAQKPLSLEEIGMLDDMAQAVKENLKKSFGMILVCGPTGSGKSTTLYSILNILNRPEVNIVTIEDPIEYNIKYINQTQINQQAGISFANALRAFLRQDPNVIMVGEIRDEETAEISVHAALTGHLLLSSLHTNNAVSAIPRLTDMKIPPFLISAVLNIIIAQRLVRKICLSCIESFSLNQETLDALEKQKEEAGFSKDIKIPKILFKGKGCSTCNFTGYQGRMGIYEVVDIDNDFRDLIARPDFSLDEISNLVKQKGLITMFEDGLRKAELGLTTIEEIFRVIRE